MKKISVAFIGALIALSLVGCGNGQDMERKFHGFGSDEVKPQVNSIPLERAERQRAACEKYGGEFVQAPEGNSCDVSNRKN